MYVHIGVIRDRPFSSSTARISRALLTRKVQKCKCQRIYWYKSTNTDTLLPDPPAAAELQGQAQELASYLGVPLFFPRDSPPEVKEVEAFKVPATSDVYPYGVIE